MAVEKVYLKDAINVKGLLLEVVNEALGKAKKEQVADATVLAKTLGLTDLQFERLEKSLKEKIVTKVESEVQKLLLEGKGVEFKHIVQLYVQESGVTKNALGNPKQRLAIKTRKHFKEQLNK